MQEELFNGADKLMGQGDVAVMLGISTKTLENWRWRKIGPRFIKIGRLAKYRLVSEEGSHYNK